VRLSLRALVLALVLSVALSIHFGSSLLAANN